MPNYKYACTRCDNFGYYNLPLSTDPKDNMHCTKCEVPSMTRRISKSNFTMLQDNSLGGWYKNNTGKELLGG